jgi:hypothetical protein
MSESNQTFGGLAEYLSGHLGRELIAEFECGSEETVRKAGTLMVVQPGYMVLRDEMSLRETVCALDHLCFVTFYLSGTLPRNDAQGENGAQPKAGNGGAASAAGRAASMAALNTIRRGRKND